MKKRLNERSKGITLVALVVTIVVLLILAGITITYVFGDNSVFKKASEAKLKTDIANWQEKLELAKGPIMIEGVGSFDANRYFEYIEGQKIINSKENDVIDNGDGTYEVTVVPGYVFEVELMPSQEKPTDVKIEYIGEAGKLLPRLRRIIVTGKTKTSIDIKISARLEGGEVQCYYKRLSEVIAGEEDNDITGYTEIILNEKLEGNMTGLMAGETYKIKAVLKKDTVDIDWTSTKVKTGLLVTKITLDKQNIQVEEEKTVQLIATIEPDEAEDKTITWSSSDDKIATVNQKGLVTGVMSGTATITATANDGSEVSASCIITVTDIWAKIERIAKAIADDGSITSSSTQATGVTAENEEYDIKVGDIFKVRYNNELKRVRVLGFKHDDLVDKTIYGGNHTKAGITFEFLDFMIGNECKKQNGGQTNKDGWAATSLRKELNGYTSDSLIQSNKIGGMGLNLGNKQYIKQVKKEYNGTRKNRKQSSSNL